ncbi:DUF1427 family protein [Sphingomonas sp. 22R3R2A-7]|uniref:XapX domain-containing protein n=1 Tax=Sphingomonas sp. 22R3R2A-7 TaxID=3050230 RepID=UPI003FA69E73
MKPYLLSLVIGLLVGAIYALLNAQPPAPPVIRFSRREALASTLLVALPNLAFESSPMPDLFLANAKITTLDRNKPVAQALGVRGGRLPAVGTEAKVRAAESTDAVVIARERRLISGLIDSHTRPAAAPTAGKYGCATGCAVHGHEHAAAVQTAPPPRDLPSFWGALRCACWAV